MESTSNYEDFEPLCKWKREQNTDTLEVHLPGFKRQQLKVQVSSSGMLIITGERQLDEAKNIKSRFRKEIPVSKDYRPDQFHAKFSNGILYLIMPKQMSPVASNGGEFSSRTIFMNVNKRIAFEIIVAISLAVAVGAYVKKYCQCSLLGN